eukprot:46268-Prymnesium_polylepis.1
MRCSSWDRKFGVLARSSSGTGSSSGGQPPLVWSQVAHVDDGPSGSEKTRARGKVSSAGPVARFRRLDVERDGANEVHSLHSDEPRRCPHNGRWPMLSPEA